MNKLSVESNIASEIKRRILDGEYAVGSSMPTQRKLAVEFKTSPTTISQALTQVKENGLIELSPGRGTRVLPLSERPHQGAIGIIYHGETEPVRHEPVLILNGIYSSLSERFQHYQLLSSAKMDMNNIDKELKSFAGVILLEAATEKTVTLIKHLKRTHFPYVVANLEKSLDYTCTWVDHQKTTAMAVKVLTAFGHRRIAFITRDLDSFFYENAFKGYKQGLEHVEIPFDKNLVATVENGDYTGAFYEPTKNFLRSCKTMPTAIIVGRDYQASGVWQACEELGLKVGEDISIIGFDNISWPQEKSKLTTFKEPAKELGKVAAEMIIEQITYGFKSVEKREIEAPLILRSSVGPCRESGAESLPLELWSMS
jgi:DNA-binding LacI/PurR family transcriptional regulator